MIKIDKSKIKYVFLGETNKVRDHGGIMILCTHKYDEGVSYGVSFCSPNDDYNKVIGKEIANKRLYELSDVVILGTGKFHYNNILLSILSDIRLLGDYPEWVDELILTHMFISIDNLL